MTNTRWTRQAIPSVDSSRARDKTPICVQIEAWHLEQLISLATILKASKFWDGDNEDITEAYYDANDALDLIMLSSADGCSMEYRIISNECSIILQKKVGEEWETVSTTTLGLTASANTLQPSESATAEFNDCELLLGIPKGEQGPQGPQGPQGTQGIQGPQGNMSLIPTGGMPPVSEQAKYCYASDVLTRKYAEELQSTIQVIQVAVTVGAETVEGTIDALVSWFPLLGSLTAASAEYTWEGWTAPNLEYIKENVTEPAAIEKARDELYCAALSVAVPGEPLNMVDVFDAIDYPLEIPELLSAILANDTATAFKALITNMDDLLDSFVGVFTASTFGYLILKYMSGVNAIYDKAESLVGLDNALGLAFTNAASNAAFFDARTCNSCPDDTWSHVIDFEVEGNCLPGFMAFNGTWGQCVSGLPTSIQEQDGNQVQQRLYVELWPPHGDASTRYTAIIIDREYAEGTYTGRLTFIRARNGGYYNMPGTDMPRTNSPTGRGTETWQYTDGWQLPSTDNLNVTLYGWRNNSSVIPTARLYKITLEGIGKNPFVL